MEIFLKRLLTNNKGRHFVVAPDDYPGVKYDGKYTYEHRAIWWLHYKSMPPDGWHIHHINGNPKDNRIENLEALNAKEHAQDRHHGGKQEAPFVLLICHQCKIKFQYLERRVRAALKTGQTRFFCTKSCQVSYQNQFKKGTKTNYPKNRKSSKAS